MKLLAILVSALLFSFIVGALARYFGIEEYQIISYVVFFSTFTFTVFVMFPKESSRKNTSHGPFGIRTQRDLVGGDGPVRNGWERGNGGEHIKYASDSAVATISADGKTMTVSGGDWGSDKSYSRDTIGGEYGNYVYRDNDTGAIVDAPDLDRP